ncbi:MAG: head-tail connector protein [Pseudomonadota bacterium]
MILIEEATVPDTALPVDAFKAHLRLGTGFAGDVVQDDVLKSFLRAAMAAIEARTGKVLIDRGFRWTLNAWRDAGGQVLPVAPVSAIRRVVLVDRTGAETELGATLYRLEADAHRPRLRPMAGLLPAVPQGGEAVISFDAGLAIDWAGLPADLAQAVLLLAAHYYEYRDNTALSDGCMPFGVTSLLQRYRPMRIGFGGGQ